MVAAAQEYNERLTRRSAAITTGARDIKLVGAENPHREPATQAIWSRGDQLRACSSAPRPSP